MKFRRILEVIYLRVLQKKMWVQFHDLCVQNRSGVPWNSDAFRKYSACKVHRKSSGDIPRYMCPKIQRFAVMFRRICEAFAFQALQKKFWAHFPDLCVQKRSCLPWSSDAFRKFSACKFYRKSSGRIFHDLRVQKRICLPWNWDAFWKFCAKTYRKGCGCNSTISVPENEAVCCEVQTHFGTSLPPRFTEKVVGTIPRFVRPKTKLLAVKFRRILEVQSLQVLKKKLWAQFHDCFVQERSCLLWNSDTFWSSLPAGFTKKLWTQFHDFCVKNQVVCCEIQAHFGVLALRGFRKTFRVHYHDLCVQKLNCLPWCSDAFWKFSASKVYRESSGQIFTIVSANEAVCREVQTHIASFCLQDW